MKPISPDRLADTLARARARLADIRGRRSAPKRAAAAPSPRRLPVRIDYVLHLLPVEEIVCAETRQRRTLVRTKTGEYPSHYSLTQLLALLPRGQFLRVHDSCLVNLDEVRELIFLGNHAYEVRLSNGQRCPVSRARYAELREALGLVHRP